MGVTVELAFVRRIRRKHLAIESRFGHFRMRGNMKSRIRVISNDKNYSEFSQSTTSTASKASDSTDERMKWLIDNHDTYGVKRILILYNEINGCLSCAYW